MTNEQWGPWIQHDGSGVPAIVKSEGLLVQVKLLNPRDNFNYRTTVTFVTGKPSYDKEVEVLCERKGAGESWTLPISAPDILYVSEYRIKLPPGMSKEAEHIQSIFDRNWIVFDEKSNIPNPAW